MLSIVPLPLLLLALYGPTSLANSFGRPSLCDAHGPFGCSSWNRDSEGNIDRLSCADESPGLMDWASRPVHTDSFQVKTDAGTTSYRPGEYLSIHVTSHDYDLKYRGILLHAVDENGVSVGEMRFPRSEKLPKHHSPVECPHAALHTDAELKPFRSVFRFKAPEAGTGKLTFRCLVKTGPANTGDFWYERASVRAKRASEASERANNV